MGKTINFSFAINGLLDPSFNHMTSGAQQKLGTLKQQALETNNALKGLKAGYKQGTIGQGTYNAGTSFLSGKLKEIKAEREKINTELQGKITTMLDFSSATKGLVGFGMGVKMLIAEPLAGVISTAANFESAMSKVGAITNASAEDMKKLTATAKELGEKTQFSATQSAEAMSYLGMAGWKTEEIISGMPGLLNLAAAGGTDLARTADIVSDDLTAFGLSADQAGHMADVYAVTITKTNTNVEMLGETMKYTAPVAHAFGVSMEETAALSGMMANAGIKASQAGTALRSGFLRLAGPPKMAADALAKLGMTEQDLTAEQKEAAIAMESLGIQTGNTEGPQKMASILTQLRDRMKDMSQEEQLATAKAIFGTEAASGWLAVLNAAPGTFEDLVQSIQNSDGAASKMAQTMQNNAKGALTRLSSAMESVAISVGGVLLPSLANAGDAAAGLAGGFSRLASENPGVISGALGMTGAIIGTIAAYKTAQVIVTGYRGALLLYHGLQGIITAAQLGMNAAFLASPVGWITVGIMALVGAGYALYKNWDTVSSFISTGWETIKSAASTAVDTVVEVVTHLPYYAGYAVGAMVGWFAELPGRVYDVITSLPGKVMGVIEDCESAGSTFISMASEWGSNAVDGLIDWFTNLPGRLTGIISDAWESAKGVLSGVTAGYQAGSKAVGHNAYGGIYPRGEFLTTFAEDSPEAAIPLDGSHRAMSLWETTGHMLGAFDKPQVKPVEIPKMQSSNTVNVEFSPNITVQGNADQATMQRTMQLTVDQLKRMLKEIAVDQRRLSYE